MFKVNNRNRTKCEICSKLTIKTLERRRCFSIPPENIRKPKGFGMYSEGIEKQRRGPCVFIVNFEHISHLVQVFLLLTMSR